MAVRLFAFTVNLLLPARSPMLPAVEVRFTAVEVRVELKLPATIAVLADRLMEFGAVRLPAKDKPPPVEVMAMSVPLISEPAVADTEPLDSRLNVAPAAESALIVVLAPVFWMKTLCPAVVALADTFAAETTNLLLPAMSPMAPFVDVRLTVFDVSVDVKLAPPMVSRADRVIEEGALILPANASPPFVEVSERSVALMVAPAIEETLPLDNTLKVAPAPDAAEKFVLAAVFWTKTF